MKIKDIQLTTVNFCGSKDSVVEVAKKLRSNKERHIIVVDSGKPIGIISTTDINNRVVAEEKDPKKLKAEEIMTAPIIIKDINDNVSEAYIEMLKNGVYSVPVTEKGKLKGTLSVKKAMNHLVKAKLEEK